MRTAAFLLGFFAWAGDARRVQTIAERWRGISEEEHCGSRNFRSAGSGRLDVLATFLQGYPSELAFKAPSRIRPVAVSRSILEAGGHRAGHLAAAMSIDIPEKTAVDTQEASSLLRQLNAEGLAPPMVEVVALLQQMRREGVDPDAEIFNIAIDASFKEEHWAQAAALFEDMRASGLKPDIGNFNAAILAYGCGTHWEKVQSLLEEMPEAGVKPDITTFNFAIMAFLAAGKIDEAFRLLHMLKAAARAGKYPSDSNTPILTMVSEAYIKAMTGITLEGQHEKDVACLDAIKAEAMRGLQNGSVPSYENPQEIHEHEMMKGIHEMHARVELLTRPRSVEEYLGLVDPEPAENPYFADMKGIRQDALPVLRNARDKQSHRSARYYFCSDEDEHYYWKDDVANLGGIYVGVAAEQNYLISAWTRPEIIILMDLNPYISQLHKAYGVSFALASTPNEFLDLWRDSDGVDKVLDGVVRKYGETKEAQDILAMINGHPAIGLGFIGLALENIQKRYEGEEIDCFLTNQEQYDFLRNMWRTGRVLPILGDLTGNRTLADICSISQRRNLPIKVFYMSNAMYHITVNMFDVPLELLERFRDNFMKMAFDEESLLLHTIQTSANQPGGFKIKSKDLVRQAYICKILGKDSQIPGRREPGKAWVFQATKGKEFSIWLSEGKKRVAEDKIKAEKREKERLARRKKNREEREKALAARAAEAAAAEAAAAEAAAAEAAAKR